MEDWEDVILTNPPRFTPVAFQVFFSPLRTTVPSVNLASVTSIRGRLNGRFSFTSREGDDFSIFMIQLSADSTSSLVPDVRISLQSGFMRRLCMMQDGLRSGQLFMFKPSISIQPVVRILKSWNVTSAPTSPDKRFAASYLTRSPPVVTAVAMATITKIRSAMR